MRTIFHTFSLHIGLKKQIQQLSVFFYIKIPPTVSMLILPLIQLSPIANNAVLPSMPIMACRCTALNSIATMIFSVLETLTFATESILFQQMPLYTVFIIRSKPCGVPACPPKLYLGQEIFCGKVGCQL